MADVSGILRERLESDAALRQAVRDASDRRDVIRLLAGAGLPVSMDDIWPQDPNTELSDAELAEVGGGMTYPSCVCPPAQTMVWPLGDC